MVAAVEEGNVLLREAIVQADEENLQNLETIWRGRALAAARDFAREHYDRYAQPFSVTYEYIAPPAFRGLNPGNEVAVGSREVWSYGGPTRIDRQEAFEFTYTLSPVEADRWVITSYTYRNLPLPTPTRTPTPAPAAEETPPAVTETPGP